MCFFSVVFLVYANADITPYKITIWQIWVHQTVMNGFEMLVSQYMFNGIHGIYAMRYFLFTWIYMMLL